MLKFVKILHPTYKVFLETLQEYHCSTYKPDSFRGFLDFVDLFSVIIPTCNPENFRDCEVPLLNLRGLF